MLGEPDPLPSKIDDRANLAWRRLLEARIRISPLSWRLYTPNCRHSLIAALLRSGENGRREVVVDQQRCCVADGAEGEFRANGNIEQGRRPVGLIQNPQQRSLERLRV